MRNIPNILTALRLLIVPFIPISYIHWNNKTLTFIIVLIAAISDFLDGFIARKFHLESKVGAVLDPFADKLMLLAIIITLYLSQSFPLIYLIIYLTIEGGMIIAGAILYTSKKSVVIPSNIFGKTATALFFGTALYTIFFGGNNTTNTLFLIILTVKVIALSSYIYTYYKRNHAN